MVSGLPLPSKISYLIIILCQTFLRKENIIAECFDSAANMGGISRALHTVYKGMFTSSEYTYIVVVNLALQDTLTEMESLQNTLGSYNQLRVFTISYTEVPNV